MKDVKSKPKLKLMFQKLKDDENDVEGVLDVLETDMVDFWGVPCGYYSKELP